MKGETDDTLRDDYDFSEGVRGKYRHFSGQARTLGVRHHDGSVTVETVARPFLSINIPYRNFVGYLLCKHRIRYFGINFS